MRKQISGGFTFVVLIGVLNSCAIQTNQIYDTQADFSKYKTFCWMNGCEQSSSGLPATSDSLVYKLIKEAIILELERKGLKQDQTNPDLLVGFTVTIKDEEMVVYHRPEDTPVYFRPIETDEEVVHYLKGSLIIGLADARESKMVWQSQAVSYMETRPNVTEENVDKAIRKVLKNFPPQKNK